MSAAPWTVGRYVVETLAANGIDTVFGIPGVHNIELYRGLEVARVRHVLVRHEQNAVFAADGYARASGQPAAAFVISGPGVSNALTALAQAWSDSVPLLLVASAPPRGRDTARCCALPGCRKQRRYRSRRVSRQRNARRSREPRSCGCKGSTDRGTVST